MRRMTYPTSAPPAGLNNRSAQLIPSTFNDAEGTVEIVWSTGAAVRRYDWNTGQPYDEILDMSPEAVNLSRFASGGVQVLDGHNTYGGVRSILGIAERGWIENGQGRALIRLSKRPEMAGIVADIRAGIIRAVSVGYSVEQYEKAAGNTGQRSQTRDGLGAENAIEAALEAVESLETEATQAIENIEAKAEEALEALEDALEQAAESTELETVLEVLDERHAPAAQRMAQAPIAQWRAVRWTPQEISFVTVPADQHAGTRAQPALPSTPYPTHMPTRNHTPSSAVAADIVELCQRHGMPQLAAPLIRAGADKNTARAAILKRIAKKQTATHAGGSVSLRGGGRISTVRDEHETRLRGMEAALWHRLQPTAKLPEIAQPWRGLGLPEMARECLHGLGVNTRGMGKNELISSALRQRAGGWHTTGDFPALLGGVGGRRLRQAYENAPTSYQLWARRGANLPDFRITNILAVGGAPELKKLSEGGEYTYGTISEDATGYRAFSYGRALTITRHMLVNDDLGAFDRLAERFGEAARRLENRLVYEQITGNPPMQDGRALFHNQHGNLSTGAGTALTLDNLSALRSKMRKQKDLDGENLINLTPAFLIVGSELEQLAYTFTSNNYVPARAEDINEFRAGGRTALEPIVEPLLDETAASAWYLAARPSQIDTVEYAYVEGSEGLRWESFVSEEVDGIKLRATLDFAAKAIDWRGLQKSEGQP